MTKTGLSTEIRSPHPDRSVVAVVGATGFVGDALIPALLAAGQNVRLFGRAPRRARGLPVFPLSEAGDLLGDVRIIIHLAGIVHRAADAASYKTVNVDLPNDLIRAAARNGVERFIFISSTHVHGRWTVAPMSPDSAYAPASLYGQSKMEAEQSLSRFAGTVRLSLDIVRPPLVYGPGAKANFGLLLKAARRGIPLPLGDARRSVVSLDNLAEALVALCLPSAAAGRVFLPADPEDASVREIYRILCDASGAGTALPPAPLWLLRPALSLLGRAETFDSLFRTATIDRSHWTSVGWKPRTSLRDGLTKAARAPI